MKMSKEMAAGYAALGVMALLASLWGCNWGLTVVPDWAAIPLKITGFLVGAAGLTVVIGFGGVLCDLMVAEAAIGPDPVDPDIRRLESRVMTLEEEKKDLRHSLKGREAEIHRLKLDMKEMTSLKNVIERTAAENAAVARDGAEEIQKLKKDLEGQQWEVAHQKEIVNSRWREVEKLRRDNSLREARCSELQDELKAAKGDIRDLQKEVDIASRLLSQREGPKEKKPKKAAHPCLAACYGAPFGAAPGCDEVCKTCGYSGREKYPHGWPVSIGVILPTSEAVAKTHVWVPEKGWIKCQTETSDPKQEKYRQGEHRASGVVLVSPEGHWEARPETRKSIGDRGILYFGLSLNRVEHAYGSCAEIPVKVWNRHVIPQLETREA